MKKSIIFTVTVFSLLFTIVAFTAYVTINYNDKFYKQFQPVENLIQQVHVLDLNAVYTIKKIQELYQDDKVPETFGEYQVAIRNTYNELHIMNNINNDYKSLNEKIVNACKNVDLETYKHSKLRFAFVFLSASRYEENAKYCESAINTQL